MGSQYTLVAIGHPGDAGDEEHALWTQITWVKPWLCHGFVV